MVSGEITSKAWTPEEIRELRKSLGLDQDEFARALGIDVRTLIKWETPVANYRQPSAPGMHILNGLWSEVQRAGPEPVGKSLSVLSASISGAVAGGAAAGIGVAAFGGGLGAVAGGLLGGLAGPVGLGVLVALGIQKLLESTGEPKKG